MKLGYNFWMGMAWLQAVLALSGSLYVSQVIGATPCLLCWWQRIFMYPLVLLIVVGIRLGIVNLPALLLPMSIAGGITALYHVLLQAGVFADTAVCTVGGAVSCAVVGKKFLGIATLPQFSLVAFVIITICLVMAMRSRKEA